VKQELDEREAQVGSLQRSKKNKKKPRQKSTPREHNNPRRKRSGGTPTRYFDDSFSREITKPQIPAQNKRTMIRVFQQRASPRRRRRSRDRKQLRVNTTTPEERKVAELQRAISMILFLEKPQSRKFLPKISEQ
jgi:hypothetical protein